MLRSRDLLLSPLLLVAAACASDSAQGGAPPPFNYTAEAPNQPAPTSSAGTPPSATSEVVPDMLAAGGSAAALPTSGETATSGPGGSGGQPSVTQGGSGGQISVAQGGTGGAPPDVSTGSAGCGRANPPSGAASLNIRGAQADYVVTLPNGYDAVSPVPLIFAFHGRGRTHVQLQTVDASGIQTELGARAVMVYMKSQGGTGWNFAAEVPPSIEFFDTLYPQVLSTYCVDTTRVFAVGHSSGAYFADILACRYGDRFRGVGDVAGALQETNCAGEPVAGIFIHGVRDSVVPNAGGRAVRDQFIALNGCQTTSRPASISPCVAYDGCQSGFPVQWCEHNEPTYDNTNHGWPSFASRAIAQFLFALP